jgi:hypothetical protein
MTYPKSLQYYVSSIRNYSRSTFKVQPQVQSVSSGQQVIFDLPSNALVDMTSLTWMFRLSTTGGGLPRNIESLISRVDWEVNGQVVASTPYFNQIFSIIGDLSFPQDCIHRRQVMQNGLLTAPGTSNVSSQWFMVQNFLVGLASAAPSCIDTSLLGNVRLRLTLESPNLLVTAAGGAASYAIDANYALVDVLSIDDGVFYQLHEQYLARGGVYQIPFRSYTAFPLSALTNYNGASRFAVSSKSIDMLYFTFLLSNYQSIVNNGATPSHVQDVNTLTFARCADTRLYTGATNYAALSDAMVTLNGTTLPAFRAQPQDWWAMLLNAIGDSQDTLGGLHPSINSFNSYLRNYFVAAVRLAHPDDSGEGCRVLSGYDSTGSMSQFVLDCTGAAVGTGATVIPFVIAQCTSVLNVGAGRQISVVQ